MKTKKPMWLALVGIIGCSMCAAPLVLPLAASALGISAFTFSFSSKLYGALLIVLAVILVGVFLAKKRNARESHTTE